VRAEVVRVREVLVALRVRVLVVEVVRERVHSVLGADLLEGVLRVVDRALGVRAGSVRDDAVLGVVRAVAVVFVMMMMRMMALGLLLGLVRVVGSELDGVVRAVVSLDNHGGVVGVVGGGRRDDGDGGDDWVVRRGRRGSRGSSSGS